MLKNVFQILSLCITITVLEGLKAASENRVHFSEIGVVDYTPARLYDDSPTDIRMKNMDNFVGLMRTAYYLRLNNMIIFPEFGLTTDECERTVFPSGYSMDLNLPEGLDNLCDLPEKDELEWPLRKISCSAGMFRMYTVINIIEMNGNWDDEVLKFYFTTLIFNDRGVIVGKYRKKNLPAVTHGTYLPGEDDMPVIETERYGKFGVLSGWDFLFYDKELRNDLDYIALTSTIKTQWPFLYGPSLQAGFSKRNNISVITSSIKMEENHYAGGGVYLNESTYTKTDRYNMIELNEEQLKNKENTIKELNFVSTKFDGNDICLTEVNEYSVNCDINATIPHMYKGHFKKATCLHNHPFNESTYNMEICALVHCPNGKNCSFDGLKRMEKQISNLSIKLKYNRKNLIQALPIKLHSNFIPSNKFYYVENDDKIKMELAKVEGDILVFGLLLIQNREKFNDTPTTIHPLDRNQPPFGRNQHLTGRNQHPPDSNQHIPGRNQHPVGRNQHSPGRNTHKNAATKGSINIVLLFIVTFISILSLSNSLIIEITKVERFVRVNEFNNVPSSLGDIGTLLNFDEALKNLKYIKIPRINEIPAEILKTNYSTNLSEGFDNLCGEGEFEWPLKKISSSTRMFRMYTVINLIELNGNWDDEELQFYFTSFIFNDKEVIVGKYRKKNLTAAILGAYLPGEDDKPVIETERYGKFGALDFLFYDKELSDDLNYIALILTVITHWLLLYGSILQAGYSKRNNISVITSSIKMEENHYAEGGVYFNEATYTKFVIFEIYHRIKKFSISCNYDHT